ncbi:cupin domain-containing protein [Caulobacter segnis]|uniref:Cupin 2 conserved barrel domain protein n=3 Tax=Caulobacter segnis TaxID=88688 RepID=D5VLY4_CAUST|nr:cupin domain-containing protein [Caulobacter segnis]ADG11507.1 Cupin 2 conserved barrel domain protein [Caulobacter segnis ATCC 21756]AVQ03166.1 cupin domain-containing protein [Caulobacter segnis]
MNDNATPTCRVVRPGEPVVGKQGLTYEVGVSAETVGARAIHMQTLTLPPGARGTPHKHEHHETAIFAIEGVSGCWYGEDLREHARIHAGDYFYIPANMPHLPYNDGEVPFVAVIARTDPNEQEGVVLLDDPGATPPPVDHSDAS